MRVLFALGSLALGVAGINAASADVRHAHWGQRTAPLVIYDFQPGVVVRAYWRAPWRHRHYYPTTGDKPEVGRDEYLSAASQAPEPPESFQRNWSTSSAFLPERARAVVRAVDEAPDPRAEQFSQPPVRAKP